ncbi:porin [Polynucleobacter sp. MWH-UH24A]|uniref:porin n=1 Tax=Polynucleobacter sp. MWH-UH24A TaxID=2689110 RepID=UPI001BFDE9BA|nr:porin [Polynucleobacter sp. MWH-UH24A]QWD76215.1 porin [Polynucleobacter sp. MWH-UH24A]
MKKSLFAIAAATAFAGAAQAQSSVTVYGIIDAGWAGGNTRNLTSSTITSTGPNQRQTYSAFTTSAEQSSRLGFRGTEDLGGGDSAFFTVEVDLNPTSTTTVLGNTRQAFAGLAKKGLGNFSIGTQYTIVHSQVGATDPGQQNNMVGSVIYPHSGGTNASSTSGQDSGIAYTVRTNNVLQLQSERMAGIRVTAQYGMNNADRTVSSATTTSGKSNTTTWGAGLDYTLGKLYATAVFQNLKNESSTITSTTVATLLTSMVNATSNQYYVGATYDFGILKAYAGYINRKDSSTLNSTNFLSRTAQQIGVRGFATKTIEYWASMGNGRWQSYGASQPTANFTAYQVGSNYWLSKRTNMYAIFGSSQTSSTSVSSGAGASQNSYALGVRHTF